MARIKIDLSQVQKLAKDLENAFDVIAPAAALAINTVATAVRADSAKNIVSQVNLDAAYVDGKVLLKSEASATNMEAQIEVSDEPVFLNRFVGARQKTKSVVWSEAMYAAKFGSLDAKTNVNRKNPGAKPKMLPWMPRKGDPLRGISAGQKAAGMSIKISKTKGETDFRHLWLRPILSGRSFGGNVGTFQRNPTTGAITAKYGPSPYQVVKGVWRDGEEEITDHLETSVTDAVTAALQQALGT